MLFENEKESIENIEKLDISDDGSVDWADVLSDSENIVPIRNTAQSQNAPKKQPQPMVELGDELEIITDDEDIDDQELLKVLNSSSEFSTSGVYDLPDDTQEEQVPQEEFDINSQLNNATLEQDEELPADEDIIIPRKEEVKKSSSVSVLLIAVLFAVLVVAGVYYIIEYTKDKNVNQEQLDIPALKQDDVTDITKEELEQRNEEKVPVINEEDIQDKKTQEEEKKEEDKKQVIVVTPSGRANPFLPVQKYIQVDIPTAELDFDGLGIPKPPKEYATENILAQKMMTIAVSGIMYDENKPSAIITYDDNDYFVQRGDRLDEYHVVEIGRNYVAIASGKNVYRANVGEEFKITSDIGGSAKYINSNGGRQYYSVNYQKAGYVSENDVEIKVK